MPNRIIREGILTSHRVNSLGWEQECFYRRLMSVVDDYGRFEAHTALLRAALYPLKLDKIREITVERLLTSVQKARLVRLYEVAGKRYLQLLDFRQQTRSGSKYPPPEEEPAGAPRIADAKHVPSTRAADAKQVRSTRTAGAKHMISNAHLDVSVSEGGCEGDIRSRSRARAGARDPVFATPSLDQWLGYAQKQYPDWPEDDIRSSWEFYEKGGWLFGRSEKPIRSWEPCVKRCYGTWRRGLEGRRKNGVVVSAPDFDPSKPNAHTGGYEVFEPAPAAGKEGTP